MLLRGREGSRRTRTPMVGERRVVDRPDVTDWTDVVTSPPSSGIEQLRRPDAGGSRHRAGWPRARSNGEGRGRHPAPPRGGPHGAPPRQGQSWGLTRSDGSGRGDRSSKLSSLVAIASATRINSSVRSRAYSAWPFRAHP